MDSAVVVTVCVTVTVGSGVAVVVAVGVGEAVGVGSCVAAGVGSVVGAGKVSGRFNTITVFTLCPSNEPPADTNGEDSGEVENVTHTRPQFSATATTTTETPGRTKSSGRANDTSGEWVKVICWT